MKLKLRLSWDIPLRPLLCSFFLGLAFTHAVQAQDPVLGDWYTLDDDTGEIQSIVSLSLADDGTLIGIISKLLEEADALCDKCEGDKKDKPIEGMQFIWAAKKTSEGKWEEGKILDPESGSVYNGNMTLLEDPNKLEVHGYIGISLFGRSQVWMRVNM